MTDIHQFIEEMPTKDKLWGAWICHQCNLDIDTAAFYPRCLCEPLTIKQIRAMRQKIIHKSLQTVGEMVEDILGKAS